MADRPVDFGVSDVTLRTLDDNIEYAVGPRPFTFSPGERGFVLEAPRDLPAMVDTWNRFAAEHPQSVYPVPRV
jgi:hypothetical protein